MACYFLQGSQEQTNAYTPTATVRRSFENTMESFLKEEMREQENKEEELRRYRDPASLSPPPQAQTQAQAQSPAPVQAPVQAPAQVSNTRHAVS